MTDKYFKVFNILFSLKAISSYLQKKRKDLIFITELLTDFAMLYCMFITGFNHVRQIQNKAELKIIKIMNT